MQHLPENIASRFIRFAVKEQSFMSTVKDLSVSPDITEKTNSISQLRYVCALGANHTVSAIPRAIPITHCGPGCSDKQHGSLAGNNGYQGSGYGGGAVVPSTNFSEKEVVFGGTDRLHELIESSLKILDADLFVVLTGCIPELVGDDVASVVAEFQEQGYPIVAAETGGFHGNNFIGHEVVTQAIIDQYVGDYDGPRENGTVNVWSLLPYQNTFWHGDLAEIKRILSGIGLKVNILFGSDSRGVLEWRNIPKSQFNLVLSPWLGLQTAKHLEEKYGQPFLHIPSIPIGAQETSSFLRRVAEYAGLGQRKVESFIRREETNYYHYLEDLTDFLAQYWWGLPATYSVVGDSAYNLALNRFLVNQLGLIPVKQIITENPPKEYRELIREQYLHLAEDVSAAVDFDEDGYIIHQKLLHADFGHRSPLILGSSWEKETATELKAYLVEVGYPVADEVVIDKSYVGYTGALTLLSKIYSTVVSSRN
jgi:nitrogenase molybdenum-iron protein beta chain